MKWIDVIINGEEKTATDELGNVITKKKVLWSGQGRIEPWTNMEIIANTSSQLYSANGRMVTRDTQRIIVPVDRSTIDGAKTVTVDGHDLKLTQVEDDSPRWCTLTVEVYKR